MAPKSSGITATPIPLQILRSEQRYRSRRSINDRPPRRHLDPRVEVLMGPFPLVVPPHGAFKVGVEPVVIPIRNDAIEDAAHFIAELLRVIHR